MAYFTSKILAYMTYLLPPVQKYFDSLEGHNVSDGASRFDLTDGDDAKGIRLASSALILMKCS